MSFDRCQMCGRGGEKSGYAITHRCDKPNCPQQKQRDMMNKIFEKIPQQEPLYKRRFNDV